MDLKGPIIDLLTKVKLTRSTITRTVRKFKRLDLGKLCKTLKTLTDVIIDDLRGVLESQRRHVLSCMLQRAVGEIGPNETSVLIERDLAPYLTAKERCATTRARVTEVKDDPIKTL